MLGSPEQNYGQFFVNEKPGEMLLQCNCACTHAEQTNVQMVTPTRESQHHMAVPPESEVMQCDCACSSAKGGEVKMNGEVTVSASGFPVQII